MIRQVLQFSGFDVQQPDIGSKTAASGYEGQLGTIRRQRALIVHMRVVGQSLYCSAVRAGPVQVCLAWAITLGGEDDPFAIAGKGRVVVENGALKQLAFTAAVGIGNVQLGRRGSDPVHEHDTFLGTQSQCLRRLRRQEDCGRNGEQEISTIHDPLLKNAPIARCRVLPTASRAPDLCQCQ